LRNVNVENEDEAKGNPVPTDPEEYNIHNRFNFSSNVNFDQTFTFFSPVMESASFYINGTKMPNVSNTTHTYYKYLIPSQKRLARPIRNIYTYSFSMNPINVEPSGSLDFSQIQSDKTAFEVKLDKTLVNINQDRFTLHMYYTGYQTFVFDRGFMSIAY
jgi:CRISPR/Cas system-associated protein Cas7 (RAMP superfamily)